MQNTMITKIMLADIISRRCRLQLEEILSLQEESLLGPKLGYLNLTLQKAGSKALRIFGRLLKKNIWIASEKRIYHENPDSNLRRWDI